MAEYIDRKALLEKLCDGDASRMEDFYYNAIADFPAADVVEVVRCKDCKHSKYKPIVGKLEEREQTALLYCTMFVNEQHIYEDDFCSYGERKADNGR